MPRHVETRLVDRCADFIVTCYRMKRSSLAGLTILIGVLSAFFLTAGVCLAADNTPSTTVHSSTIIGDARHLHVIGWSFDPMQYSAGYVLGTLIGVHRNGRIIQTLEGSVKVGQASTAGGYVEQYCIDDAKSKLKSGPNYPVELQNAERRCTVTINPWPFSSENEYLLNQLASIGDSEVVLYYRSYFYIPFTLSDNYLEKVYLVDPTLLPRRASFTAPIPLVARIPRLVTGYYVGRVVKASYNNVIRKAREIVIQQGVGGGIYNEIAVPDRALFNFIIETMATGRYVRLYYYVLMRPLAGPENIVRGYTTDYRAYKVELLN